MNRRLNRRCDASALVTLLACCASAIADGESLLPKDTEFAVGINVQQAVQSGIGKKLIEIVRTGEGAKVDPNFQPVLDSIRQTLEALSFSPLTDLHEVTLAGVIDTTSDKGLLIVRGQFDVAKFEAVAAKLVATGGDALKADMIGATKVYAWTVGDPAKTILIAIADKTTILAAANRTWMAETLDNVANKRTSKPRSKELQALLAKVDPKRSFWVAIPGASMKKIPIDEGKLKENISDVESLTGGITLTDDIQIDFAVVKSNQDGAKESAKAAQEAVRTFRLGFWAAPPLQKLIDTVKITVDGTTLKIESHISAQLLKSLGDQTQKSNETSKAGSEQ